MGRTSFPRNSSPLMIATPWRIARSVYGDGQQVRDWLYVEDHCRGILAALRKGAMARSTTSREPLAAEPGCGTEGAGPRRQAESLIGYVTDRPGHDRRYALSSEKLMGEPGGGRSGFRDGAETDHRVVRREFAVGRARAERRVSGVLREIWRPDSGWLKAAAVPLRG